MAASKYILVSLPLLNGQSANATWSNLYQSVSNIAFDIPIYKFQMPDLRVGTLDSLLSIGDDLTKTNAFVEGVTCKIRREIEEIERFTGSQSLSLCVNGVPVEIYFTRFSWDEAKYPVMAPIREIVNTIQESVAKLDIDLKVRVAEYTNAKNHLSNILRQETGSLLVRNLSSLVRAEDIVSSEHLTTLLVVVSKFRQKDWMAKYERLSTFVVPKSSRKLHEDNDYALYNVTLFRNVTEIFKAAAHNEGFQVREFEFDPTTMGRQLEELERLQCDKDHLHKILQQWCYASYGEAFSAWIHICTIQLFSESILRYGLPPTFLAAALAPKGKDEQKVRRILDQLSGGANSMFWNDEEDDLAMVTLIGGEGAAYPYISLTVNLPT
ncbi:unnamed protein product [Sphagnum troendelagicum]|uniref:V-type proton ATPase subunit C n=1 Tax=Sphagnum troendelagicum TaxID=128251 RepID=A0ABP0UXA8_9BRYO